MAYEKVNWKSTTPINAANLNKMDNAIEQHFNEVDANNTTLSKKIDDINDILAKLSKKGKSIRVYLSADQTTQNNSRLVLPFDTIEFDETDGALTLSEGKIVIGAGISAVLVHGQCTSYETDYGKWTYIHKNDTIMSFNQTIKYENTMANDLVVPVVEGDTIYFSTIQSSGSSKVVSSSSDQTFLQVTII